MLYFKKKNKIPGRWKKMKLILRWHFINLGHSDDKEEIIISSLVLFSYIFTEDNLQKKWFRWAWLNYWLWKMALYCCQKSSAHFWKVFFFFCLWLFCVRFVMRAPNVYHIVHTVCSFSKVSQISFWLSLGFMEPAFFMKNI